MATTCPVQKSKNSQRALSIAVCLSLIYIVVQFYGARLSGSLALLADAGHMLANVTTMLVAFIAAKIAFNLRDIHKTAWKYEVFGGFINAIILIVTASLLILELGEHLETPHQVHAQSMGLMASIGFFIHLITAAVLYPVRKNSLNTYAAFIHISFDVVATVVNIVTSALIYYTNLYFLDSMATFVIVAGISFSGIRLLLKSGALLLDTPPVRINRNKIRQALKELHHIKDVHQIRIRPRSQDELEMSAHIVLSEACYDDSHWLACQAKAERILKEEFGIAYSVLQIEYDLSHTKDAEQ